MLEKLLRLAWHYAHAFDERLFQRLEWTLLRKAGIPISVRVRREIWRTPGESEDWINLFRFLDPAEPTFLIDVGANIGDFTGRALQEFSNLKSACLEPGTENYAKLSTRFAQNSNVALYNFAASNENVSASLYTGRSDSLFSLERYTTEADQTYGVDEATYGTTETVECRRIDSFHYEAEGRHVLLKMDVQGHEVKAMEGAIGILPLVDVAIIECSFANEYEGLPPSFSGVTQILAAAGLYPIVFQDFGRLGSYYAFERDVIFVREPLLKKIWLSNYFPKGVNPKA